MNLVSYYKYILSADIGGSHITTAICDIENNIVLSHTVIRNELDSKGSSDIILNTWIATIKETLERFQFPVSGIAFAMPGPFDYINGISYINGLDKYEALFELDIKTIIADALGFAPEMILFRNDAEATIAGEVFAGAGRGYDRLTGITLGTGFGSAQFKEGVARELNWGNAVYKDSIADDYFTTRWFCKRYHQLAGVSIYGVKELATAAEKSLVARGVFEQFSDNLAEFLKRNMAQSNPDVLLVCGNIAKAYQLFLPNLIKRSGIKIIRAELGEMAALIGAAALFSSTTSLTKI